MRATLYAYSKVIDFLSFKSVMLPFELSIAVLHKKYVCKALKLNFEKFPLHTRQNIKVNLC